MRPFYLGRALSLVLACAALACGGEDEKPAPRPTDRDGGRSDAGRDTNDDEVGDEPAGEDEVELPAGNDAEAVPDAQIGANAKMSELSPGEAKGLCLATIPDVRKLFTARCKEGLTGITSREECADVEKTCEESDAFAQSIPDEVCERSFAPSEECAMTVGQYRACTQTLINYYDKITCESEPTDPPACLEQYEVCFWSP